MKKRSVKLLSALLALILVFPIAGCVGGSGNGDDTGVTTSETEDPTVTTEPVKYADLSGYCFVYPATAPKTIVSEVKNAAALIESKTGLKLKTNNDWVAADSQTDIKNDNLEILVGDTNRVETKTARKTLNGSYTYTVAQVDKKIVLLGGSEEATVRAVGKFAEMVTNGGFPENYSEVVDFKNEIVVSGSPVTRLAEEYVIIYPLLAALRESTVASDIAATLNELGGKKPRMTSDLTAATAKEIVVGNTSRTDASSGLGYFEYSLSIKNGKIFLLAGSTPALAKCYEEFVTMIKDPAFSLDDKEIKGEVVTKSELNPIIFDLNSFTPSWAEYYTPPTWLFDFDEKTYAVTCPDGRITIKTHRGDMNIYPENSIEGLASAILAGTDCIEVDVQMTKDGVWVLMHDASLKRTTDAANRIGSTGYPTSLNVSEWTYEQIRTLNLVDGQGNPTGYKVPTLYEALLLFAGRVFVQIDDKSTSIDVKSESFYRFVKSTGAEKCFFYYYGTATLDKWLEYDPGNKALADYNKTCKKYLSETGHAIRAPYWPNDVNKWDGGKLYENEQRWASMEQQNHLMIWSQNTWRLSKYMTEKYTSTKQ